MHINAPNNVGNANATSVHLMLDVSFFTVIRVVEHGQCIRKKTMQHMAVIPVHPFETRID